MDFKEYLLDIEKQTNQFEYLLMLKTNKLACEGFYMKLQSLLDVWSHWQYVPNQTGGFMGLWYYWVKAKDHNLYIQIENSLRQDQGLKLTVRIDGWKPNIHVLYKVFAGLSLNAEKNGLKIVKPSKYRAGASSTVAIVDNAFLEDGSGIFNFQYFISTIKILEKTLTEYTQNLES